MEAQKARKLLAEADLIHSEAVVQTALDELAKLIRERLADKNPLVLCVMSGGDALWPGNSGRQNFLADGALDFGQGSYCAGRR